MQLNVKISDKYFGRAFEKFTEEEFFDFCGQQEDIQIEREPNGQIIFMTPSFPESGKVIANLIISIGIWARQNMEGNVYDSSAGFRLPNGAVRSPDVSWLSNQRWNQAMMDDANKKRFPHVVPEFIIEVRSNSDTMKRQKAKMVEYMENGVLLGWLVDPKSEKVWVYQGLGNIEEKSFNDTIDGGKVLIGFTMRIKDFV